MSQITGRGFTANLNSVEQVPSANGADPIASSDLFQESGGLVRFKSAPSSFLASLMDSNATDNSSSGDDESEAFLSALMCRDDAGGCDDSGRRILHYRQSEAPPDGSGQMGYESAVSGGGGYIVGSYSLGMESQIHKDNTRLSNSANDTSIARQRSSPAGFLNGFGVAGEAQRYRVHSQGHVVSSANRMSSHLNFSSNLNQNIDMHNLENGQLRNGNDANEFEEAFPQDSWNDSLFVNSLKRNRDGEMKLFPDFNDLDNRNARESRKVLSGLVQHLRSVETEKLLQFQPETVPCHVRAKRGCATHPRSIAERVRRTRISEKMKKLQDLFPNMDKQTSTADMLEMAVGYITDLQKQVQRLTDKKAKCICLSKPQQA